MRNARITITGIVTLAVAIISYRHIMEIALAHGNDIFAACLYPLPIDGLIIGCTVALLVKTGVSKATRKWATIGRYFGFAATLYANILHSGWTSIDGIIVNGIPAVSLIILVEVLINSVHGTPATRQAAQRKRSTKK
jgi:hypothetical protein